MHPRSRKTKKTDRIRRYSFTKVSVFLLSIGLATALTAPFSFASPPDGPKTALVIIDMQPIFVTRGGYDKTPKNVEKVNQILKIQLEAIERAKHDNMPIVVVQYANEGKTNEKLTTAIGDYPQTVNLTKNTDGLFDDDNTYKKEAVKYFVDHDIKKLIITGANGGACVRQTIEGALNEKFSVTAVSPGIADFNYPDFIYPYSNYYKDMKPSAACPICTFNEVSELAGALPDVPPIRKEKRQERPKLGKIRRKPHPSCVTCGPGVRSQAGDGNKPFRAEETGTVIKNVGETEEGVAK
jgi:nicotinamidase-related amidase